jgi:hypothetical protein
MYRLTFSLRSVGSLALLAALFLPLATCAGCNGKRHELRATDGWELTLLFILPSLFVVGRLVWPQRRGLARGLLTGLELTGVLAALVLLYLATLPYEAWAIGFFVAVGGIALVVVAGVVDVVVALVESRR